MTNANANAPPKKKHDCATVEVMSGRLPRASRDDVAVAALFVESTAVARRATLHVAPFSRLHAAAKGAAEAADASPLRPDARVGGDDVPSAQPPRGAASRGVAPVDPPGIGSARQNDTSCISSDPPYPLPPGAAAAKRRTPVPPVAASARLRRARAVPAGSPVAEAPLRGRNAATARRLVPVHRS